MKTKVAIIVPYFGKLPDTFSVWMKTARKNKNFDFYIITDDATYSKSYDNLKFIKMDFIELKEKIQNIVGFNINLNMPYKLCDYRPVYGTVFSELLKKYDFWGFGDIDVFYGDLNDFINDSVLTRYDKIYSLGHLTLLRNNELCNNLWKTKHNYSVYRFDEAWKTPYSCHFDEGWGLSEIAKMNPKVRKYSSNNDYYDIYPFKKGFFSYDGQLRAKEERKKERIYFMWENGKLFRKSINGEKKELAYVHFQKRKIRVGNELLQDNNQKCFYFFPNEITTRSNTDSYINNWNYYVKELKFKKIKQKISGIKIHSIQQSIFRKLRPLLRETLIKNR